MTSIEKDIVALANQHFALDFSEEAEKQYHDFRAHLMNQIAYLLDHNLGLFFSMLYRIDVLEKDVKHVFATSAPEALIPDLTDLIIDRLRLKAKIRLSYREKYQQDISDFEDE